MEVVRSLSTLIDKLNSIGRKEIGLVPTKGALHQGHAALIAQARRENFLVVITVFLHPNEFANKEAMALYPSDPEMDENIATAAGGDFLLYLNLDEIYPKGCKSYIMMDIPLLEQFGASVNPLYYRSYVTTISILLNSIRPINIYTSNKDVPKLFLLTQLLRDLQYNCNIRVLQALRDEDGLFISAKNQLLTDKERKQATVVHKALTKIEKLYNEGTINAYRLKLLLQVEIEKQHLAKIEYVEMVEPIALRKVESIIGDVIVMVGVRFGKVRITDYAFLRDRTEE